MTASKSKALWRITLRQSLAAKFLFVRRHQRPVPLGEIAIEPRGRGVRRAQPLGERIRASLGFGAAPVLARDHVDHLKVVLLGKFRNDAEQNRQWRLREHAAARDSFF